MSNCYGNNIKLSIFGESHGKSIGLVIDGMPPGIKLDMDFIYSWMERRKPGKEDFSTKRSEADRVEFQSGIFNEMTTGTPICAIIKNTDTKSKDYSKIKDLPRPSHADYSGFKKYRGFNDYRGGGHFSARITAPFVFAGALAMSILKSQGITVSSVIRRIGTIIDNTSYSDELYKKVDLRFPVLNSETKEKMTELIYETMKKCDSIGGIVETQFNNVPVGIGMPFFHSLESQISSLVFSVPAVKGIEFGAGFAIAELNGSVANDAFYKENEEIKTKTNNSGGINGGISNGMPIIYRAVMKPTASIFTPQDTVNMKTMETEELLIKGRHDPCIVPRAIVVLQSCGAIAILDSLMEDKKWG